MLSVSIARVPVSSPDLARTVCDVHIDALALVEHLNGGGLDLEVPSR